MKYVMMILTMLALIAPASAQGFNIKSGAHAAIIPSGPITVSSNGVVIANLDITAPCTAIEVGSFSNVTIRNVRIRKNTACPSATAAYGINATNASNLTITNVEIFDAGMPIRGANPSTGPRVCIRADGGTITASHITVWDCSTGVYLTNVVSSNISYLEGHNMRGPYPRGMTYQNASGGAGPHTLTYASAEDIPGTAWPEDNFSIFATPNATLSNIFVPFTSDSLTGRGTVIEQPASANVILQNAEYFNYFNGVYAGTNGPNGSASVKSKDVNLYSVRGLAGSSSLGTSMGARFATVTTNPADTTAINAVWSGMPSVTPDGMAANPGDYNVWYNPDGSGIGTVTNAVWTQTQFPIRNAFSWRNLNGIPAVTLPVRIGSYWLDGVFGTSLVNGAVVAVLPGVYTNSPTTYSWQWTKNGGNIVGQTTMNLPLSGLVGGDIICVKETASNVNGSAPTQQACVTFP